MQSLPLCRIGRAFCVLLIACCTATARAQDGSPSSVGEYQRDVRLLLAKYCFDCHGAKKTKAALNLETMKGTETGDRWKEVWARLQSHQMPPTNHPQPSDAEAQRLVAWLEGVFSRHTIAGERDPGPLPPRRLTVRQYMNSLRDLLALGSDAQPRGNAFGKIPPPGKPERGVRTNPDGTFPGSAPAGISGSPTYFRYQIHSSPLQHPCAFVEANLPADTASGGFDTVADNLSIPPFLTEKYLRCTEVLFDELNLDGKQRGRLPTDFWLLKREIAAIRKLPEAKQEQAVADFLKGLASRAFRKPVEPKELTRHLDLYRSARKDGQSLESAIWLPIQAILVSPRFVVLWADQNPIAESTPKGKAKAVRALDDFELANRLAEFLWSSLPDRDLTEAAAKGQLHDPKIFEEQVRRMLKDERIRDGLLRGFLLQWLQLAKLEGAMPDSKTYRVYYVEQLGEMMRRELMIFTEAILWNDHSVLDFIDADWAILCEPLLAHYEIRKNKSAVRDRTDSAIWQKVSLPDKRRGGLLGMGVVMTGTSKPERTSPVNRGKWILETIFGITPPPPPPDVDNELKDEEKDGKPLTVRQKLERHRENAACASCHRLIDPLGLGFENFDPIGRWRDQENGLPIDAASETIDGRKFLGAVELKELIVARKEDFVRNLTEKMLAYALGRQLEHYDIATVREIAAAVREDEYRFSRLVFEVTKSYPFQHRRAQGENR